MKKGVASIIGTGIGAGLMYYLDPERGRRRRAMVRDQMSHGLRKAVAGMDAASRDVVNRVRGTGAVARSWVWSGPVSDEVLTQRVRSAIGRVVGHPASIEVTARDGVVTLSGPILAHEVNTLLKRVAAVGGVKSVEDRLEVYEHAGNVPGLQGRSAARAGELPEFWQSNWSPAARLAAGLAGGSAFAYGLTRRGVFAKLFALSGLALAARAATNLEVARLTGVQTGRRGIDIQKTLRFNAPVERVFELWTHAERFPQFMAHVREVRKIQPERWRWSVTGPGGAPIEFDAVISALQANRLLGWRTEEGSIVQHSGIIRFLGNTDGSTTVDIKLTYNPIAGAAGHAVAKLLGADPKHLLDDDLMRMKSFIETGRQPHDAAAARKAY